MDKEKPSVSNNQIAEYSTNFHQSVNPPSESTGKG
jgi:hypothetical protein